MFKGPVQLNHNVVIFMYFNVSVCITTRTYPFNVALHIDYCAMKQINRSNRHIANCAKPTSVTRGETTSPNQGIEKPIVTWDESIVHFKHESVALLLTLLAINRRWHPSARKMTITFISVYNPHIANISVIHPAGRALISDWTVNNFFSIA